MTVDAAESWVTDAAEVSSRLADAAPAQPADVGRYVLHARRIVGRYRNGADVKGWKRRFYHSFVPVPFVVPRRRRSP